MELPGDFEAYSEGSCNIATERQMPRDQNRGRGAQHILFTYSTNNCFYRDEAATNYRAHISFFCCAGRNQDCAVRRRDEGKAGEPKGGPSTLPYPSC